MHSQLVLSGLLGAGESQSGGLSMAPTVLFSVNLAVYWVVPVGLSVHHWAEWLPVVQGEAVVSLFRPISEVDV